MTYATKRTRPPSPPPVSGPDPVYEGVLLPRYRGTLFVVASGPSLLQTDLDQLKKRGVAVMTLNNAWSLVRSRFHVVVDPPDHFSDLGWKDPGIPLKFVPNTYRGRQLMVRNSRDRFVKSRFRIEEMPGVVFYKRALRFNRETFFKRETPVSWGHGSDSDDSEGLRGGKSVMHAAIRIGYDLGFRHFRLVGADFYMDPMGRQYAFEQDKDKGACQYNNKTYSVVKKRIRALDGELRREGGSIVNCSVGGRLDTIQRMSLREAVERVHEPWSNGIKTEGWYTRRKKGNAAVSTPAKEVYNDGD